MRSIHPSTPSLVAVVVLVVFVLLLDLGSQVEAVEVLLDHEESIHKDGEPWVGQLTLAAADHLKCISTSVCATNKSRCD